MRRMVNKSTKQINTSHNTKNTTTPDRDPVLGWDRYKYVLVYKSYYGINQLSPS